MDNETKDVLENAIPEENSNFSQENIKENDVSGEKSNLNEDSISENSVSQDTVFEENSKSNEENIAKPEKKGESLESILRRFKRQSSGIVAEIKKREAYEKPSVKRKKKSELARRKKGKYYNKW